MSAILSDDDELFNGLGSEEVITKPVPGNHMARTRKRWSSGSADKRPKIVNKLIDGVHTDVATDYISPGQLYSTESGRLFHAGKILIVLVGLPATSKTLLSVAITRYTRWLGVRTRSFHVSEYRREKARTEKGGVPNDYYSAKPGSQEGGNYRREILRKMTKDMTEFFDEKRGQLAVYDALNILKEDRSSIEKVFGKMNIKVLFIESVVTDPLLQKRNVDLALKSADYKGWALQDAEQDYMSRLKANKHLYEEMSPEENLSYVKYINFGEKLTVNNNNYGYLINKIVFFLMNLRDKRGRVYFARCGTSVKDKYIDDEELNEEGLNYSKVLTDLVLDLVNKRRLDANDGTSAVPRTPSAASLKERSKSPLIATSASLKRTESTGNALYRQPASGDGVDDDSFVVWTAPRKRTYDTAKYFAELGISVRQRNQLQQLHPGVVADMSDHEVKEKFTSEYQEYLRDPYHFRFSRAESYHDLAVRMEPLLLEMERMCGDILIIGHESTLRVLYGYLMAFSCSEIPRLTFTRDELIEISFGPFENKVNRIPIVMD
ncbi:unnamed protein product [Kluyveromyces dobzhanskii CBS 2104]|uniref:WGS project CCBQ000000000 data, contig 00016 n=1 Tax=Kluyveromyces dobzhanskii CBS 2104 TaxID=1427455 RepID=A0A0A8L0B2_9SACH|nr:unnamed protein product [Kluyveromyces dobzhanskii CBS 2104]